MTISFSESQINQALRNQYEAFSASRFSLRSIIKWQDGYKSSSHFAARLYEDLTGSIHAIHREKPFREKPKVLLAGCGELQPFVVRKLENPGHKLYCVDVSRTSLYRARFRLAPGFGKTTFIRSDINEYLGHCNQEFDHIDISGLLPYLVNPAHTIRLMAQRVKPGGTIRLRVHNTESRNWIHQIRRVFHLMELTPFVKRDLLLAKSILKTFLGFSPHLNERLDAMQPSPLSSDARFVNTFFTVYESRLDFEWWYQQFSDAGLRVYALNDQFGELDHLPNPMWLPPSVEQLSALSQNGLFSGDLDLYLCHLNCEQSPAVDHKRSKSLWPIPPMAWRSAPSEWADFLETGHLPSITRSFLWFKYLTHVYQRKEASIQGIFARMSRPCLQRLARVGAILPKQLQNSQMRRILSQPMASCSTPITDIQTQDIWESPLADRIEQILAEKGLLEDRRYNVIMKRLEAAHHI